MTKKIFVSLPVVFFVAIISLAQAQQAAKIARIGYLSGNPLSASSERTDAFREGLRELGYVEGKNFIIEYRSACG